MKTVIVKNQQELLKSVLDGTIDHVELGYNFELTEIIPIHNAVTISGYGVTLDASSNGGFFIDSGDVVLEGIHIRGGGTAVTVDPKGKTIENVTIRDCYLEKFGFAGIFAYGSEDNSVCKNLLIEDCVIKSRDIDHPTTSVGAYHISFGAAFSMDGRPMKDCLLDGLVIKGCTMQGACTCNVMGIVGLGSSVEDGFVFERCNIKNVRIENSVMKDSFDTAIVAQANFIGNIDCTWTNFDVLNNKVEYCITGVSATGGSPMFGKAEGVCFRGIRFIGNEIYGREGGAHEPDIAIWLMAAQIDYYTCSCEGCSLEDIEVRGNYIHDAMRGIAVCGSHAMIDAEPPCSMNKNYVSDIVISENRLENVADCFCIHAAWIDGRRSDWWWSFDHRIQNWQPAIRDHHKSTLEVRDNYIKNMTIINNVCNGFRNSMFASGARGRGNGVYSNNKLIDNIVVRNNKFINGENHCMICDSIMEDWCTDQGGNEIDPTIKYSI